MLTMSNRPVINTKGVPFVGPFSYPPAYEGLTLHHYCLKSRQEFMEKAARGSGNGGHKPTTWFDLVDGFMNMECRDLMNVTALEMQ